MTTAQPTPTPTPTAVPMETPREGDGVDVAGLLEACVDVAGLLEACVDVAELLEVCVDETVAGAVDDAVCKIMVVDMIDGVPVYVVRSVAEPLIVSYPSVPQYPPR